jgi:predicted anti-sigma-YlaC factor YlaD
MRCDQAYELIGANLDEELSGGDRTSVADHIESCAGCRVLISDYQAHGQGDC